MGRILNLVVPGAGLILQRREWLGFSLALIFGICGNIAIAGWLIAPEAMPMWLTGLAAGLAAFSWGLAQVNLWRCEAALRLRTVTTANSTAARLPSRADTGPEP
jgi:hypothetical protein